MIANRVFARVRIKQERGFNAIYPAQKPKFSTQSVHNRMSTILRYLLCNKLGFFTLREMLVGAQFYHKNKQVRYL